MRIDLSRPDVLFAAVWLLAIALLLFLPAGFVVDGDPQVQWLVGLNMLGFFVIYRGMRELTRGLKMDAPRLQDLAVSPVEQEILRRFLRVLLIGWLPLYALTVLLSGGMPMVWLITGSGKTYTDFGVSSLSGLLNMVRAFIFAGGVLLFILTRRKSELLVPGILLLLCIAEVSRGGILVLLLHGVAVYVLTRRVSLGRLLKIGAFAVLFIVAFGILGDFRGASVDPTAFVAEDSAFTSLPLGFFFAFTYLVSPLNNLYYGAPTLEPLHYPFFSLQPLLPTVVRDIIFSAATGDARYPIALFNSTFNATSFYGPLLADFGFAGAGIVVTLIQVYTAWVHVLARRGSLVHFMIYPALFMSVLLSVFYMYFFALIVVLYPLLAYAYRVYRHGVRVRVRPLERLSHV